MREYTTRGGHTEDGDYIMVRNIEVDTVAEAREVTRELNNEVTRGGCKAHYDIVWTGQGGKLVWSDTYVVDATEVAIEASNDYHAWARGDSEHY
jgi:hypothetical protein